MLFEKIRNVLKQPYPLSAGYTGRWLAALCISLFIFSFLYVFRPFGLYTLPPYNALSIIAGYGVTCFAVLVFTMIIVPFFLPGYINEEKWTVGKQIFYVLFTIFCIGIGNAVYTAYVFKNEITVSMLIQFQLITLTVSIFPVAATVWINQMRILRKNQRVTDQLTASMHFKKRLDINSDTQVTLSSDNKNESLAVPVKDIVFITSADNYIEVHFIKNGKEQVRLLRSTLKTARESLRQYTAFYRCHRGWIVNLDHVKAVTGNAQGYRLIMNFSESKVPVARNLNKELTQRLSR